MILLINSYSFVALGLLVLLVVGSITWRLYSLQWAAVLVSVTLALLIAYQFGSSTKSNIVSTPEDFNNVLASKRPVLVELYSNL